MKKVLFALMIMLMLLPMAADGAGVIQNSTGDSTHFDFFALDSTGNLHDLASGDSVWIIIRFPNGQVAYRDSVAFDGTEIVAQSFSNYTQYAFRVFNQDFDGGTAVDGGVYTYCVIAKDNTTADLGTPYCGDRQLYEGLDYAAVLDLIDIAISSRLAPTVGGRDLDVTAGGNAGLDWSNVETPGATVELSNTTIRRADTLGRLTPAALTQNIGVNFNDILGTLDAVEVGADFITAAKIAPNSITSSEAPNLDAAVSTRLALSDSAKYMNTKSLGGEANTTSPTNVNEAFDGDATGAGRIVLVETTIDLTNLPSIPANWLTAAGIDASALDGKGDWNIGKAGYTLDAADWENVWKLIDTTNVDSAEIGLWLTRMLNDAHGTGSWEGGGSAPDSTSLSNILHRIVHGTARGSGSDSSTLAERDVTVAAFLVNAITSAAINASALDGKGDWNIGKAGYSLLDAQLSLISDSVLARWVVLRGIVKTLPGASGFSSTALTDVDDYLIHSWVYFVDGNLARRSFRIDDLTASTDSVTILPVMPEAPAIGDSFYVLSFFSETPAGGSGDWTSGEKENIRDALGVTGAKTTASAGQLQTLSDSALAALEDNAVLKKKDSVQYQDLHRIDGDAPAANNLEAWFDNSGFAASNSTVELTPAGYIAAADTTLDRALDDTTANSIFAKIMRDASAASAQAIANNTAIGNVQDTATANRDSLQSQADWIAKQDYVQTELIQNGGFETNNTNFWTLDSGTTASVISGGYGRYYLNLGGAGAIYTQNLTLDSGWYQLSWNVLLGVSSNARIWVYDSLQSDTSVNRLVSAGGAPLPHRRSRTAIFRADSTGAYEIGLRLVGGSNAGIDEIKLKAISGPFVEVGTMADSVITVATIKSGAFDSSAIALSFLYKFFAYNDSTALDLENQAILWQKNNFGGGAGGGNPSTWTPADSEIVAAIVADTGEALSWGAVGGGGSGVNGWTISVFDTAGLDTTPLPNVKVEIEFMTGLSDGVVRTNSFGDASFNVDLDSFRVRIYAPLRFSTADSFNVTSNGQVDSFYTYTTGLPPLAGPDLCNVFAVAFRGADPVIGARLLVVNSNQATDTTQQTLLAPFRDARRSDSTGQVTVQVPRSYLFHDSTKARYDITLFFNNRVAAHWEDIWIPNQDSLRLVITD